MSNNNLIQMTKSGLYSTLFLIFLSLFGCASVGSIVPVEKRVALSEARTIQDTFKADGWRVDYSYIVREGTMSITCRPSVRFKVEAFDTQEKILPRAGQISVWITIVYLGLTLIWWVGLWLLGMTGFDAIIHAMTTIATGGY